MFSSLEPAATSDVQLKIHSTVTQNRLHGGNVHSASNNASQKAVEHSIFINCMEMYPAMMHLEMNPSPHWIKTIRARQDLMVLKKKIQTPWISILQSHYPIQILQVHWHLLTIHCHPHHHQMVPQSSMTSAPIKAPTRLLVWLHVTW